MPLGKKKSAQIRADTGLGDGDVGWNKHNRIEVSLEKVINVFKESKNMPQYFTVNNWQYERFAPMKRDL